MVGSAPDFYEFNDPSCLGQSVESHQPTVVLFVPRHHIGEGISKLFEEMERLSSQFSGKVKFFWLPTEMGSEVCREFQIDHLPQVVLFSAGKEKLRLIDPSSEGCLVYNLGIVLDGEKSDYLRPVSMSA